MRVGFDIGGTFTDIIALGDDGRIWTRKILSLLERVADDVAMGIRPLARNEPVECFVHGTTVASNAVIEGTAARTAFITTRGFRDELEMRGQRRPNIYDLNWDRLPALVPRALRLEVAERILGDGTVERPLDIDAARKVIATILTLGVEAVAVCLINSYLNDAHERQLGRLLAELAPELVACLSCDVHPEIKEYERASTTVINASLIPVISRYLDRLEHALTPLSPRILVMQSNGGVMSTNAARSRPAYIIESGPAAGVLAAARLAGECALDRVISFDMGGTTVKACLIEQGIPLEKPGSEIGAGANVGTRLFGGGGHVVRVPSIDIVEAGAGGGSIAWIDDGGALRVGPRSAGAEPGPVCYGRGGVDPTVTDANVALGYINPKAIAGASIKIDRPAALAAIKRALADPLKLGVLDVAYGVTQVANSAMTRVLRAVSTERGRDPREFTMIAFGGAGPIHAAPLAENLSITKVIIPLYPGLFSALGLLLADHRHDYIASIVAPLTSVRPADLLHHYERLKDTARDAMAAEGLDPAALRFEQHLDLKYGYQMYEMTLPFPGDVPPDELISSLAQLFTNEHDHAYGYHRDDPIELVSVRVRALSPAGSIRFADLSGGLVEGDYRSRATARREAFFGPTLGTIMTPVCRRFDLEGRRRGPLIIEEPDTTIVVPPGWIVERDPFANVIMSGESG
jgi:N-methylhydantoinase A